MLRVASKIMRLEGYACSTPTIKSKFIDAEAALLFQRQLINTDFLTIQKDTNTFSPNIKPAVKTIERRSPPLFH